MVDIELTRTEAQTLRRILHDYLSELAVERAAGGIELVSDQAEEGVVQKVLTQLNAQDLETLTAEMQGEYSG